MPERLEVEIRDWVALRASTHPGHPALECSGETWTYADLDRRVGTAAAALVARGVVAAEPVAVLAGNGLEIARFAHAVPRAGGAFMPLNARLSASELAFQLQDARARFLVATRLARRARARRAGCENGCHGQHPRPWPDARPARGPPPGAGAARRDAARWSPPPRPCRRR